MKTEINVPEFTIENLYKLNSICRICLNENIEESVCIFDSYDMVTVYEEIMLCTRVKIETNDGLPNKICKSCHKEFEAANTFRLKCENSDSILQKYYLNILADSEIERKKLVKNDSDLDKLKLSCKTKQADVVSQLDQNLIGNTIDETDDKDKGLLVKSEKDLYENLNVEFEEDNTIESLDSPDLYNALEERLNKEVDVNLKIKKDSNGSYSCPVCGKPLKSKVSLERHLENMHKNRSSKGVVTGYGAERKFHCTVCEYTTKHSQSLVYHSRIHTGERPYRCDICNKTFTQPGSLSGHRKKHSDKMYYTCAECGKQFKYKDTYERHKNVHVNERKFICTICNKGLKSATTLEGHMNRHYNIKNYSCEVCGVTFVTKVELLNHNKKHIADRRFHCHLCEYKTYLKKGLEVHLKRHSGDRPFKCDQCEVACYTHGELKCHIRKHTRERNYSCPLCSLRYIHSSSVNKHMLKTHGIKYLRNDSINRRVVK